MMFYITQSSLGLRIFSEVSVIYSCHVLWWIIDILYNTKFAWVTYFFEVSVIYSCHVLWWITKENYDLSSYLLGSWGNGLVTYHSASIISAYIKHIICVTEWKYYIILVPIEVSTFQLPALHTMFFHATCILPRLHLIHKSL